MCSFHIEFSDGTHYDVEGVTSVTYVSSNSKALTVLESELSTHLYPFGRPLWLTTAGGIRCVSGADIRVIEVFNT